MVRETHRLVVVEEGSRTLGWGAEVLARGAETFGKQLVYANRVAALDLPLPASGQLEKMVLPDIQDIVSAVMKAF